MRFVETPVFTREVVEFLDDEDLTTQQLRVLSRLVREEFE